MGVWIETCMLPSVTFVVVSHPSWVCGLKHKKVVTNKLQTFVTPFVGVWIETAVCLNQANVYKVTPFVGVWIETGEKQTHQQNE